MSAAISVSVGKGWFAMLGAATTLGDLCHRNRARLKHLTRCSHPAGTKPPPHQQAETPTGQEHDGQQELELIHLNSRPRLAHLEPKWKENKVGYLLTSAHFLSYETAFLHKDVCASFPRHHPRNKKQRSIFQVMGDVQEFYLVCKPPGP